MKAEQAGSVAQVVEHLPGKCTALFKKYRTTKKKKKKDPYLLEKQHTTLKYVRMKQYAI
jgi:hypothetical protein